MNQMESARGRTHIKFSKIGLQLASKNLESSRFSNTIGAHKSKNLSRSRNRQSILSFSILEQNLTYATWKCWVHIYV
jgi:hypothetical protein